MPNFFELVERWCTHPMGGRIGKDVMISLFKLFEPSEEIVILCIGDNRSIENIVSIVVLVDVSHKFFDLFLVRIGDRFHRRGLIHLLFLPADTP
jgi:hypothetical protein